MGDAEIKRMIQIGVVSSVDKPKLKARVIFRESGMVSGWLPILQRTDEEMTKENDHDHSGAVPKQPKHMHKITTWVPKVNDVVLVAYPYIRNSDGFILGRIP